jgi:UDP-N-acetylglucosamine 2-epimerase
MKIVSVVGARPEFIQAAMIRRALRVRHREVLVHTGQHYDDTMAGAFFRELDLGQADYDLDVGSGSHGRQTGEMLARMERVLEQERPDLVIVRGDTNSTLAGALAAAKLAIPVAHIEAGERSFQRAMPEEINRLVADALAEQHFCASRTALRRVQGDGAGKSAWWVGDVMLDAMLEYAPLAAQRPCLLEEIGVGPGRYVLATVHRAANTDDPQRLRSIAAGLAAAGRPVVFPVHPRTRAALARADVTFGGQVRAIEPVGYLDMLLLEQNAAVIATDSGGVQREAYFLGKPCVTLRDETEWTETVEVGWNRLVGVETEAIVEALRGFTLPARRPALFGQGDAAARIVALLEGDDGGRAALEPVATDRLPEAVDVRTGVAA